jgi:hypothetical protein
VNLQPRKEQIAGQKEFLRNTQGMEFKTGGVTLLATDFVAGEYVKAGTAIYVDGDGMGRKWQAATVATQTGACLVTHDVKVYAGQNPVVGALVAGHPIESKCTGVTANFKTAAAGRLVFDL